MLQTTQSRSVSFLKPPPSWTVPEFLAWTENQEGDFELIRGILHMSPSGTWLHGWIAGLLTTLLGNYLLETGGGYFLPEVDVHVDEENYVCPDISVCMTATAKKVLNPTGEGRIQGLPDLAVEILSPSSRGVDLVDKRALYEEKGVKEYWIVDPEARAFTLFVLEGGAYQEVAPVKGCYASSPVLPGFTLDLNAFWKRVFPK